MLGAAIGVASMAGCGSTGHRAASPPPSAAGPTTTVDPQAAAGGKLLPLIIKPPFEYAVDAEAGATGTITPAAFSRLGGVGSAAGAGYVTGYKKTYVNDSTGEGLVITVMKFTSPARAAGYFEQTRTETMSVVAPAAKPFVQVPGAVELDGTRAFQGEYEHGVVMVHGPYYASVVYVATVAMSELPMEFYDWAKVQYLNLS